VADKPDAELMQQIVKLKEAHIATGICSDVESLIETNDGITTHSAEPGCTSNCVIHAPVRNVFCHP